MKHERVVVFTGAGVSAESGLRTFRDGDGLWEEHRIEDVATPQAWERNPELVLRFYNERRAQTLKALPNAAHQAIAELGTLFQVDVVTQNIDDLHERAGSTNVLHLHGEILLARSTIDPSFITPVNGPSLFVGDCCPMGSQLRPHIVWFGEEVPNMHLAIEKVSHADIVIVVGTSLSVYPAAGALQYARHNAVIHVVDPTPIRMGTRQIHHIREKASVGVPALVLQLLRNATHTPE